ncbi:MAG: cell division protein FtsZ [Bacteroidales bacterium]|nr:cell division protein FtsZ [Bacteroidales bacterium]
MSEELMNFDLPVERSSIIKVIGVGGGGSNAVNHMFEQGIKDVNFLVCNTDAQALENSPVSVKIQIGESVTEGRGAGNKPEVGRQSALENIDDVMAVVSNNTKMVFITAGMGGGTGTGAAPVIAKACKEEGILTVAIVTIPFKFEGKKRIIQAMEGIRELRNNVDTLLVINNEKLREVYGDLKLSEAFAIADNVLAKAARGIAEIITVHGYINVDFADVETVMANSGVAMMGSGEAEGENRATEAIEAAVTSPLLNSNDITGAKSILLNISSGVNEISMDEVGEITDYINSTVVDDVMIIWGTCQDETLGDKVSITIIATGFETSSIPELYLTPRSLEKVTLKEPDQQTSLVNSDFEIKDKEMGDYTLDEYDHSQKTIDFSITDNLEDGQEDPEFIGNTENELEVDQHKTSERIRKIKEHQNYLKDQGYLEKDKKDEIEELENQPAYIRKNRKISKAGYSAIRKVSKYSLFEDDENETKLGSDNSYLHDNVD